MKIKKFSEEKLNEGMRVNTNYLMIPLNVEIPSEDLVAELEKTLEEIKSWKCDTVISIDNKEWIPYWN